jgi:hypothetical protein
MQHSTAMVLATRQEDTPAGEAHAAQARRSRVARVPRAHSTPRGRRTHQQHALVHGVDLRRAARAALDVAHQLAAELALHHGRLSVRLPALVPASEATGGGPPGVGQGARRRRRARRHAKARGGVDRGNVGAVGDAAALPTQSTRSCNVCDAARAPHEDDRRATISACARPGHELCRLLPTCRQECR